LLLTLPNRVTSGLRHNRSDRRGDGGNAGIIETRLAPPSYSTGLAPAVQEIKEDGNFRGG